MKVLWIRLSNIGIRSNMPVEASRKIILTNQLSYIAFAIVFLMNVSFLFIDTIAFNPMRFLSAFIILINPYLNSRGYHILSAFSFSTLMPITILVFSSLSKTEMPPPLPLEVYIFPKLLLLSFLVLPLVLIDSRNHLMLGIAVLVNLSCIFLLEIVNEWMGVGLDFNNVTFEHFDRINFLIIFPIAVLLIGFVFFNKINNKYEETIVGQNTKLEIANNKIKEINYNLTDSIHYAECIQQAVLPDTKVLYKYFSDHFIYYKAKSIVSGDFYFIKELALNGKKCLAIASADSTGHGVPGGFMSMLGLSLLNEIVKTDNFSDAADILNQLRARLKLALNQTGEAGEQRDGIEMAMLLYFPETKTLEFSGAKSPLCIVDKNNKLSVYKGDRMPIGVHHVETPFTNVSLNIEGGEVCYMFTDGIVDQMNKNGKKFLTKNLYTLIQEMNTKNHSQKEALFTGRMASWMKLSQTQQVEQIDDMLLMALQLH